tara:strand:- start:720 stop:1592 length:873 start_codon:yes stop_codon:yes gene_type:complete
MGEIYRAAAVTGTRRLNRGKLDRNTEAPNPSQTSNRDPGLAPTADKSAALRADAKATKLNDETPGQLPTTKVSAKPSLAAELASQRDLSAAQERRITQLESENTAFKSEVEELRADCRHFVDHLTSLKEEAQNEGYIAGEQQATDDQQREQAARENEFEQLKTVFTSGLDTQLDRVEAFAIDIAFAAITRLVGERVRDEQFNRAVISSALADIRGAQTVTIHVSEQDFKAMSSFEAVLRAEGRYSDVLFTADPRVSVGGCMIETDNGIWDARLETQLQRLRDAVKQSSER